MKKIRLILILTFFSLIFILFSSCTGSNMNNITKTNDKIYTNSFYMDIPLTESIITLNTKVKIPFSINPEKYKDYEFYEQPIYEQAINEEAKSEEVKNEENKYKEVENKDSEKGLNDKTITIHYQIFKPENKPKGKFLLVHGFAGSTFTYHLLAPMLANEGYLVVAIDLPNFGYSERIKLKLNSNCFADLIYQFLVNFEKQYSSQNSDFTLPSSSSWQIVGHSMSGRILTVFAYKYSKIIKDLILISPAFSGSKNLPILLKIPPINLFVNLYINSLFKKENFANLLKKVYLREPLSYEVESYLNPLLIPGTIQNVLYMLDTTEDPLYNPPDLLKKIELPILLIWGDKDSIVPLDKSYKFIDSIKNKKLVIVENTGHNSMETHVDIVFNAILQHIEK